MKKKLFLMFYILIVLILLCTNVFAILTTDLEITTDKTTVKAGEDVIVSISLKNISNPIASVQGYLDIDETYLNSISKDMIVVNNDGKIEVSSSSGVSNTLSFAYAPTSLVDSDVIFNTSESATNGHDIFFTEDFKTNISKDSVILKLKLTVKSGISNGELKKVFSISNLVAETTVMGSDTSTSEKSQEMAADISITVNNNEPNNPDNNNNNNNTNTDNNNNTNTDSNTNKNTNINTNTNKNTNTNTDNTVSGTRIPATGAKTIIIPAIIICLIGFISYKKYMSYKDV